jgi:hypothetical protein
VANEIERGTPPASRGDRFFAISLGVLWLMLLLNFSLQYTWTGYTKHAPYLVGLDQNCYFAYAHTLLFDGDLNFQNQYEFLARTQPSATGSVFLQLIADNPNKPVNQFNIGTGMAALPVLAVARAAFAVLRFSGLLPGGVSHWAPIYPLLYCLANITYGVAGLVCCYIFLRRWFGAAPAAIGCWGVLLCGPLLYYLYAEPAMSHLTGCFFTSAALLCWSQWTHGTGARRQSIYAFLAGFCAAFAAVVRPYDAPVALVLIQPLVAAALNRYGRGALLPTGAAVAGAAMGALPQLIAWKVQFGHWITNTTDHPFPFYSPWALHVLFSRRHGLFFWAPALLIAVVCLAVYVRKAAHPAGWLLAVFLGVTWMAGTWWFYWIGVAFGMRSYVDHPLPFAFGLAAGAAWLIAKLGAGGRNAAWEIVALFALINIHVLICFRGGVIWVDGPLYWTHTISSGKKYRAQVQRECQSWIDFSPGHRANVLQPPPGY